MTDLSSDDLPQPSRRLLFAQLAALLVGLAIVAVGEAPRLRGAIAGGSPLSWFADMNVDTSPFLLLLLMLPAFWVVRRPLWRRHRAERPATVADSERKHAGRREWLPAMLVALSSIGISWWVAQRPVGGWPQVKFGTLPPAYHDEYSYLFQAKTFLAGRLWFPSHHAAPELFDQMHVLNDDGRFASRFFPGAGAWTTPFVAIGRPWCGHWLAGGLTAFFMFWAGRELGGNRIGLLAGLLTAASPGMALFSNLLLAHHPALAGLSLFLFAFLRMMRTPHLGWAFLAGCSLSFAMLCRPMTAAGFGLPFGVWLAWRLICGDRSNNEKENGSSHRTRPVGLAAMLSLPILAGLAWQMFYNSAITGSALVTPYQRYTDIYTPRHVYGFNNVKRGERRLGPKVLENYDRWTENLAPRLWERDADGSLTPSLASQNVLNRLQSSLRWSLALVPLAMGAVVFLVGGAGTDRRWWLVAAAIFSLHAAHVPYWYDGIMHWHYVFETGPLWLLLFAGVSARLVRHWRAAHRPLMPAWWALLIVVSLLTTYTAPEPLWSTSRIDAAVSEVAFSRRKHHAFQTLVTRRAAEQRALILVEADPSDRHIDYVTNDPDLSADILIGRFRPGQTDLARVQRLFPRRACFVYRAATGELMRLPRLD